MAANNILPPEAGCYYHIYNHANGSDNVFFSEENYRYFLRKYKEYILPVADTFSYCLMPNHFHFLVRIKEESELFQWLKEKGKIDSRLDLKGFKNLSGLDADPFANHISKRFSDYFNGYAKAINKQENRIGSLFAHPFKRKKITSEKQLRDTLIYIHNNPVHHGFVGDIELWEHSSYHDLLGSSSTFLLRDEAIGWFEDRENFIFCHNKYADVLIEENK